RERYPAVHLAFRRRPAEMLSCEVGRGDRHDTLGAKATRREVAETELVEPAAGVDQDVRVGSRAGEEVDLVEQRGVLHDQRVGLDDRLVRADPLVGDAAERRHRRAGSLRPERGERERILAFGEGRDGEQLGRRDDSLPAATVDTYLEYAVIVVPAPTGAHQRACGSRSVVLRASSRAERLR